MKVADDTFWSNSECEWVKAVYSMLTTLGVFAFSLVCTKGLGVQFKGKLLDEEVQGKDTNLLLSDMHIVGCR